MGPERQQQRDRQAVAGKRGDRGLADPDPEVAPVRTAEKDAPLVDRPADATPLRPGHQLPIAGPYHTLAAMMR